MGKLWVYRNKELVVWIIEFARKEPFVQGGKEGFGYLFKAVVSLARKREGPTSSSS